MRRVRVATLNFREVRLEDPRRTVRENLDRMKKIFEDTSYDHPDIFAFTEMNPFLGVELNKSVELAPEFYEESLDIFEELARKYEIYVVLPTLEVVSSKVYNTVFLINREGEIVGRYRKVHPTISEMEAGISPGDREVVIETEFGKVGFLICFDLNYKDIIRKTVERGAEIIFFLSMYEGGLQLRCLAFDYGIYVVSALKLSGCTILNPLGREIGEHSHSPYVRIGDINLDYGVFHLDYNWRKLPEIKRKYGERMRIYISRPEATFMIVSEDPLINVDDVVKEFGLEYRYDYLQRANEFCRRLKTGNL
ncbi:hypothetical protein DRN93_04785 [archaeon]|nr:MAG: hypothetical protein DRN93_04785 [archaeon]